MNDTTHTLTSEEFKNYLQCKLVCNTIEIFNLSTTDPRINPSVWYKLDVLISTYQDYIRLKSALKQVVS